MEVFDVTACNCTMVINRFMLVNGHVSANYGIFNETFYNKAVLLTQCFFIHRNITYVAGAINFSMFINGKNDSKQLGAGIIVHTLMMTVILLLYTLSEKRGSVSGTIGFCHDFCASNRSNVIWFYH